MILDLTAHSIARLQAFNEGLQHGTTQFFTVGTDLYFIVRSQVESVETNDIKVYKASDKLTWTLVATSSVGVTDSHDLPCVLVGTIIYALYVVIHSGPPVNQHLVLIPFDTATDTFGSPSSESDTKGGAGFAFDQVWTLTAFNDGDLLVCCHAKPGGSEESQIQLYHPGTDVWDAPTVFLTDGSAPVQSIHDPSSDLAFVFFRKASTQELRCLTIDDTLSFTDVQVVASIGHGGNPSGPGIMGMPAITTDTNEVVIPWHYFPAVGPPGLRAGRATISGTPTFSEDVVEDNSTLGGNWVQQWDQQAGPGWFCMDIGGLLYAFYSVDNGDVDDASSMFWLYYRWSTVAGTWSAKQLAYTSVVPGEMSIAYGTMIGGDPAILVGAIDPTLWQDETSLTDFILLPTAAPPSGLFNEFE